MTAPTDQNQVQTVAPANDKELNFRKQQAMYERMLNEREQRIAQLEQERQAKAQPQHDDDDDTSDAYVDHKRLKKTLAQQGQSTQSEIQKAMQMAKQSAKEELKQEFWLESHPDFEQTMMLADKFAEKHPNLAKTMLRMPEGFERQQLVYQTIKDMGFDKPEVKQSAVQDKIDSNRRSPYYQPTGVGAAPYTGEQSDFSPSGQKAAYEKIQALKNRLKL